VAVEFTLREFRPDDFESLWRIDQQCFAVGIAYSRPELAAYVRLRGSFTLVAESQGQDSATLLGFVVALVRRGGAGHVITIDVLPQARRLGVGSRLLTEAESRLRSAGCSLVQLETAVNNSSALAFYKRHGYFVQKTIARYYPDGLDAFALKKDLHSAVSAK
jgi:ribosomal-protein-alanine N-acetyltransferase